MKNQYIQKISNEKDNNISNKNKCPCCKCVTSFCYCSCDCKCHKENLIPKINNNINYEELPNLNIDELRMKSLKEYTSSNNILNNTKKALNSSRSMHNIDNHKINDVGEVNSYPIDKRNNNNLKKYENAYINKTQKEDYFNNQKRIDINNKDTNTNFSIQMRNKYNIMNHNFKTQTNFNSLRKYYQLNDSKKEPNLNNTLKSNLEFDKFLSKIKNKETINKKKNPENQKIIYNSYIKRENNFPSQLNNSDINSNDIINSSDGFNNQERKTFTNINYKLEKYKEHFDTNLNDFGFSTEYNKPFGQLNFNNKSININDENIVFRNDNNYSTIDKYDKSLSSNLSQDINSNNYLNGGYNTVNMKESIDNQNLFNDRYINKINNKNLSSLQISSISKFNLSNVNNTEPLEINHSKISDGNNINIKNNLSKTNNNTQIESNKSGLIESKDINGDNFIITFGSKGNNEIKNIIATVKNELKLQNEKSNGKKNTDENINNIINDYEKLKKKYSANRLFTGLQNNINNLNENINIIKETSNKKNQNNFSTTNFDICIKGELTKKNNEINNLKFELKEAKNKIEELTKIVLNYQKEINILKNQLTKSKIDSNSDSNSKINTINNISTSNNNSNKTKIGKDSFIIKIPESLIKRKSNKENIGRNNSYNDMINIENNENNTLLDLSNNTYKKVILKNNSNNFNNISNISNNTNSNCVTNNNISYNISSYANNEIYTKKITTTMQKKFRKSASQKYRINKLNYKLYKKPVDNKKKLIYTIITKNDNIELLSFDLINRKFSIINFIDFNNFANDFKESYHNNKENNNSIYLNNERNNNFYIVTGKNCDKLYKYNNETNCFKKICTFKNNHSNGCLLYINNKIICLSGNHNKKVEIFSEKNKSLSNLPEMNIERSSFSSCLVKNEYIFALFGYNFPTQQYLNTIEFYDLNGFENYKYNYININDDEWKYLKYKDKNLLNLDIKGHLCFNYFDEKIIFFGGFNGYKNEVIDCFYQLILPENYNIEENIEESCIEPLRQKLKDISKNRIYYFGKDNGAMFEYNQNNIFFAAFDSNYYIHFIDINNNLKHNIYYDD